MESSSNLGGEIAVILNPPTSTRRGAGSTSVLVGAVAACVVIACARLLPIAFTDDRGQLSIWFAAIAVAGLVVGAVLRAKTTRLAHAQRTAARIAIGALLVDGFAVGFAPGVYGLDDNSLQGLSALLLWGVGALLASTETKGR